MSKLLDEILSNDNMNRAYKAVKANKGASGIDNVTIDDLYDDIRNNWKDIKALILKGPTTQNLYEEYKFQNLMVPKET